MREQRYKAINKATLTACFAQNCQTTEIALVSHYSLAALCSHHLQRVNRVRAPLSAQLKRCTHRRSSADRTCNLTCSPTAGGCSCASSCILVSPHCIPSSVPPARPATAPARPRPTPSSHRSEPGTRRPDGGPREAYTGCCAGAVGPNTSHWEPSGAMSCWKISARALASVFPAARNRSAKPRTVLVAELADSQKDLLGRVLVRTPQGYPGGRDRALRRASVPRSTRAKQNLPLASLY